MQKKRDGQKKIELEILAFLLLAALSPPPSLDVADVSKFWLTHMNYYVWLCGLEKGGLDNILFTPLLKFFLGSFQIYTFSFSLKHFFPPPLPALLSLRSSLSAHSFLCEMFLDQGRFIFAFFFPSSLLSPSRRPPLSSSSPLGVDWDSGRLAVTRQQATCSLAPSLPLFFCLVPAWG